MKILQCRLVRVAAAAVAVVGWGVLLVAPTGASAALVNNRATGLTSPDTSIDFGSGLFANFTIITNQLPGSGVTFGGTNYRYFTTATSVPSISAGHLGPRITTIQPGSIFFTSDVSDAVFSWRTLTGTTDFEAYLNAVLVESFSAATNSAAPAASGKFYGFEGIVFDEIRLAITASNASYSLDNLQYNVAAVPLPAALPLFLSALAGLALLGRRRRQAGA